MGKEAIGGSCGGGRYPFTGVQRAPPSQLQYYGPVSSLEQRWRLDYMEISGTGVLPLGGHSSGVGGVI